MGRSLVEFSFVTLLFVCATENVEATTTTSAAIPERLLSCYRSDFAAIARPPPLTIQLFIELIRKIENDDNNAFNMRILATSILHGVVLDGVRRSQDAPAAGTAGVPYRATGNQFFRHRLLVDYLTGGDATLFPADSLTTAELCLLHRTASTTVEPRKRGDERTTCVQKSNMPANLEWLEVDDKLSECPVKEGVVQTHWGPVSAGHLVAAVAAALAPATTTFGRLLGAMRADGGPEPLATADVSAVWVSALAADLAGVLLGQASLAPAIGSGGFWNDTLLPHTYYLKSPKWDMTEPDILAGIDAAILANNVKNWLEIASPTRLSQLVDMYYSNRGIAYDRQYKAANRWDSFTKLLNEIKLEEQVAGTARLLKEIGSYGNFLQDSEIVELSTIVVEKFKRAAGNITNAYDNVEYINGGQMKSPVEVLVILDGSYDAYTAQQMLHALADAAQVSHYGSELGVINGETGDWMANATNGLCELFAALHATDGRHAWPAGLKLGRALETAAAHFGRRSEAACGRVVARPAGRALLAVARDAPTTNELERAARALAALKAASPETGVIIATTSQHQHLYRQLASADNDHVLVPPRDVVALVAQVVQQLADIPRTIVNVYCNESQIRLEDYITPDVETVYQIRNEYLQKNDLIVKFSNADYGDLTICALTDSTLTNKLCKALTVNGEVIFDSKELCTPDSLCHLKFLVAVNSTNFRCFENDCRFPDQVRIEIRWQSNSSSTPVMIVQLLLISLVISIMFY